MQAEIGNSLSRLAVEAGRREVVKAGWLLMQAEIGYSLSRRGRRPELESKERSWTVKSRIADLIE